MSYRLSSSTNSGSAVGAVTVRVNRGQLHRVHRGVYAVGTGALSRRGEFTAAVLTCAHDAVLAHHAAASWHDMRTWQRAAST